MSKYQMVSILAFGVLTVLCSPIAAESQNIDDLEAEIDLLEQEVEKVRAEAARYDGGLVLVLMQSRIQVLELSRAVLENRIVAASGGATLEVVVPAVAPNSEKASELLVEIAKQSVIVERAREEAARSGGLVGALALSTALTEELTLSQLRMAWYQAAYGIAFPSPGEMPEASESTGDEESNSVAVSDDPWADPEYPEIDYSRPIFAQLHSEGFRISGWWGIRESKSQVDDSPAVVAVNVAEFGGNVIGNPTLMAQCREGEASIVFDADDYLLTDYQVNTIKVTLRVDDAPARSQNWSKLTSNEGAGLFGRPGEDMLRELYDSGQVFLRITERDGTRHDSTFPLAGATDAFEAVAAACGFSTLSLDREDYKAIQGILNAAGFEAGTPDGVWGDSSRRAMQAFQIANDLPATGAADRATLARMGLLE